MTTQRTKTVFKRVERDDEFRDRLFAAGLPAYKLQARSEAELDDYAWSERRMQRRLVDDYA